LNHSANKGPQKYRRMLLKERAVLSGAHFSVDALAAGDRVSEDDQAQRFHDEFVSLRLSSLDCERLRLVEEALSRLDSGDYGICLNCDEPIPAKRLQAVPWAKYCVTCQDQRSTGAVRDSEDTTAYLPHPVRS